MKNVLLSLVLLLATSIIVQGQSDATVHLDKPYYVSGETAWFSVYLPGGFENSSGKVNLVIQNASDQVVHESFVQLSNSSFSGYYKIPFDLSTGLYYFSFYVLENQTFNPVKILDFEIPIYNDLNGDGLQSIFPAADLMAFVPGETNGNLRLDAQLVQSAVGTGDKVSIQAMVRNGEGEMVPSTMSIAIVDQNLIGSSLDVGCVFSRPLKLKFGTVLGMDERIFVQGSIYDAATNQPAKVNIIGAYNADENKMHYSRSDAEGNFTLLMRDQVGPSSLQIAGYLYEEYGDTRVEKRKAGPVAKNIPVTSEFDEDVTSYLTLSNTRKRIYQHFNQLESEVEVEDYSKEFNRVRPNKTFTISEYVHFETVGKFFDEILGSQLNFLKGGERITARMFNPESNKNAGRGDDYYFPRSPVFIVDGKMTKDADYVYKIKSDNVDEVDLYFDWRDITKQFGTFGDFGYVVIRTNQSGLRLPENDEEDIIPYSGTQPNVSFPVAIDEAESDFPVLRPLVFWHPEARVTNSRDSKIEFTTSDDVSTFRIIIVARTDDGRVLHKHIQFDTELSD